MKFAIVFAAILGIASLAPGVSRAQDPVPTFTAVSGNILNTGFDAGDFLLRWTEINVPPPSVDYVITGASQAIYACTNNGQLYVVNAASETLKEFSLKTRSGTVRQTTGIDEPDPIGISCTGGALVLYSVSYSDIMITDETNGGMNMKLNGSFTQTFCSQSHLSSCPPPS